MSMSDLECDTAADAHGQPSEPNRDHKGNLNSRAHFMIDFAAKAMAWAPTARTIADDFHELPAYTKERVLKRLVIEIMENLLKGLPEVEKDDFLDDCFTALYEKLPWTSQVGVAEEVMNARKPEKPALNKLNWSGLPKEPEKPSGPGPPMAVPPPPPAMFIVDLPEAIDSGGVQGQGKGQGSGKRG